MYASETSCMKRTSAHEEYVHKSSEVTRYVNLLRLIGCDYFSGPSRNGPKDVVVVTYCNLALELKLIESFFNLS